MTVAGPRGTAATGARALWRGVITEYRDRLPVTADMPVITLQEGGTPTASAVLGDIVAVARNRLAGTRGPELSTYAELPVLPMGDTLTRYHVSLDVDDRPGVLAPVAEVFARHDVSIEAVRQTSRGDEALLIIVTHEARDAALVATVSELEALPVVRAVASVMRVEGEEDPLRLDRAPWCVPGRARRGVV